MDNLEKRIREVASKMEGKFMGTVPHSVFVEWDSISTPREGSKMMASIGSVQQMRDALLHCRSVDHCDAMAMAPGRFS